MSDDDNVIVGDHDSVAEPSEAGGSFSSTSKKENLRVVLCLGPEIFN